MDERSLLFQSSCWGGEVRWHQSWKQIRLFQMQSLQIPITLKITVGAMMSFLISVFSVSLNLQRGLVLTVVFSLQFRLSPLLPMPGKGKIPGKRWRILMFSCCVGFRCCSYWQHLHHMPSVFASSEWLINMQFFCLEVLQVNSVVTGFCCRHKVVRCRRLQCCCVSYTRCWREQPSWLRGSNLISLD